MCSVQKWMKILELKTVFEDTSIEQKIWYYFKM